MGSLVLSPAFVPNGGAACTHVAAGGASNLLGSATPMDNATNPPCATPPLSSYLDTLETKSHPGPDPYLNPKRYGNPEYDIRPATRAEQEFRHSGWAVLRVKTYDALTRCGMSHQRIDAFAHCGSGAWLYRSAGGTDLAIRCNKCHDRWCLACARDRAGKITANLLSVLSARTCRFMTLTLRHSHAPLADQIDRLYRSFAALRRRQSWTEHVTGGAAFFECKIGKDGLWHPHLHCCVEGSWYDQKLLSREWLAVTGDSSIVDIRPIDSDEEGSRYCTKYLTKPASSGVYMDPEKLDEMIIALRGRRLCMTFGAWRGIVLEPKDADTVDWQPICSLDSLRERGRAGDKDALDLLYACARKWPMFKGWLIPPDPQQPARL